MKINKVFFKGSNNRDINGIFFYPNKENPPVILMVHGYGGEGLEPYWIKTAKSICERGFAVLTFLFSAYNSAPDISDLSLKDEIKELKLAIDFLENQNINKNKIGLFAQSLGSSISILLNDSRIKVYVLLALNPELKSSLLKFLFTEEIINELQKMGYCERRRLATGEIRKVGIKFLNEINEMGDIKERQTKMITKPVLLIWGTKDEYASPTEAQKFYKMFNEPKKIFFVEDAPHVTIRDDYRNITLKEVIDWFKKHLK